MVGYQTDATVAGFNWIAPDFLGIGSDVIDIQDIQLNEAGVTMDENIQILDEGGALVTAYNWASAEDLGADTGAWVDDDAEFVEVNFVQGQSLLLSVVNAGVKVTYAGEVALDQISFTTGAGFNWIGNGFPVDVDIQDIQLNEAAVTMDENIQVLDEGGALITAYNWASAEDLGEDTGAWVDDDAELIVKTFAAGEGFLISVVNDGVAGTITTDVTL